jgi:hypothetical protein
VSLERPIVPAEDPAGPSVELSVLVVHVAYTHTDPYAQRVEVQHQQHRAVLERLVAVEDPLDNRRIGEVVVPSDLAGGVPAATRYRVAGRLGR